MEESHDFEVGDTVYVYRPALNPKKSFHMKAVVKERINSSPGKVFYEVEYEGGIINIVRAKDVYSTPYPVIEEVRKAARKSIEYFNDILKKADLMEQQAREEENGRKA